MDEVELKQTADFLSIALECIDSGSHDVAIDFIEDVADDLEDENQAASLEGAAEFLESGDVDDAYGIIEEVNAEIIQDIDNL